MKVEWKKYKRLKQILYFTVFFLLSLLFVSLIVFDKKFSKSGYFYETAFDSYLLVKILSMPILIATMTSKAVEMEQENNMWNVLYCSGISFSKIYADKFLVLLVQLTVFQIIEWCGMVFMVYLRVGAESMPIIRLIYIYSSQWAIQCMLLAVHYVLSLKTNSPIMNLSVAVIGGLTGIIGLLLSDMVSMIYPYSWMGRLLSVKHVPVENGFEKILYPVQGYLFPLALVCAGIVYFYGRRMLQSNETDLFRV